MADSAPIFIGGLMKSGTSLFRKLLCRHQNIFGGLETHWFSDDFLAGWNDKNSKRQKWLREFFDVSLNDYESIQESAEDGLDMFDKFMWFCTKRDGKKRWLEKTPDNVMHLDMIWKKWPDAKVIHVLRDPKDIYASWKRDKKKSLSYFIDNANSILNHISNVVEKGDERYLEVRYESLIDNTENVLREILNFLNESYIDGIIDYNGDDSDYKKVLEVTGIKSSTAVSLSKPIFSTSIGQWKKLLDKNEVDTLLIGLREYVQAFNLQ